MPKGAMDAVARERELPNLRWTLIGAEAMSSDSYPEPEAGQEAYSREGDGYVRSNEVMGDYLFIE